VVREERGYVVECSRVRREARKGLKTKRRRRRSNLL
jgi:hypothetical protein